MQQPGSAGRTIELSEEYATEQKALDAATEIAQKRHREYGQKWKIRTVRYVEGESRPIP
jgi:hypothetical protein